MLRCTFLENDIDGQLLLLMINDISEFSAVIPKSGHRLKLKKFVSQLKNEDHSISFVSKQVEILYI